MKTIFIAGLLGLTAILNAQHNVSGVINDGAGRPLSGVSIAAPEIHKMTVSDETGNFNLAGLPAGNVDLVISLIGYKSIHKKIYVANQTILNLTMEPSVHEMDEVIVSTAFNRLQSQNVMKVEHASMKGLQQKGILTLIEGLATIPGVSQVSTGNSIGKPVIRGLSGNRVLVYSQGVRIENQQFGDEHGLGLNDSGVESVEVIKGPASLLYGSDALGGVI
ncbi:MAG TPA: TonB-dependent receptor plug domain-containing protein, partial [Flavobacterium sp.]